MTDESLRGFAREIISEAFRKKRLEDVEILRIGEDHGLVPRVKATAEHIARGAKCEIGDEVWVLADRLEQAA